MNEQLEKLRGDHPMSTKEVLKRTLKYIKPEIWSFILATIIILFNVACSVVMPLFTQKLVDTLQMENFLLSTIIWLSVGYLGISIVNNLFLYFESMILQKAGQRIIYSLRMEVFTHIENMSIDQFNEMPVGSLVTRVANYTTAMSDFFTNTIVQFARNLLTIVVAYIIMFTLSKDSWKLTLILSGVVVIIGVFTFIIRKFISEGFRKQRSMVSDMNAYIEENLGGMKITQLFNQEPRKIRDFKVKNNLLFRQNFKLISLFSIYRPVLTFLFYGSVALTFYFGVTFALTSAQIVAFYLYLSYFFEPVQALADQLNHVQRAKTASERLFNLLDVLPQVLDAKDAKDIEHFEGKIEFKNVWFAYKKDNWILKDVSFTIEPHQTCAFVGATGAGKTTILSLLVRNYEIQKGQILIDGIDIKSIKIDSLRKAIGQMLQDVFLFSGSIRTNITLHDDEEYKDEEIKETCEYVNANSFIDKLEKGLNSEVIERGENFSQGQRQLLSFARTVLHKPQILILDEATANIDTETEKLIQDSLAKMRSIGTMLVVAHRLSTIQNADQIICLQNGEIVEAGNHQELLKNKGYYYKLYQLQFEEE